MYNILNNFNSKRVPICSIQSIFELYDNVSYLNFIIIVVFMTRMIDG